jgi:hypothetical protein
LPTDLGILPDTISTGFTAIEANSWRRGAVRDMRMQVDEPGHDSSIGAPNPERTVGLASWNVRFDRGDATRGDRNVEPPVEPLARVQNVVDRS